MQCAVAGMQLSDSHVAALWPMLDRALHAMPRCRSAVKVLSCCGIPPPHVVRASQRCVLLQECD
jgi:hypothetical protein